MSTVEVRLAGAGGQGVVLAALLLAEGAVLAGGNATHAQAYGPQSRGGASKADVILSDGEIDFPFASHLDILVALTTQAVAAYAADVRPDGLLIVDGATPVTAAVRTITLPITETARRELGSVLGANLIALGALVAASAIVPPDAIEAAIERRPPGGSSASGRRAFRIGMELVPATAGVIALR
jgi:2-oxoglutarate ferredoxin oxidoreductase subunit gamma